MDGRSFRSERRMCSAVRSSSLSLAIASWEDWVLCSTACYSSMYLRMYYYSKLRRGAERFDSAGRGLLDGSIWSHYNTDSPVSRQELVAFIDVDVYVPCTITAAAAALSYRVRFSVLAAAAAALPPPRRRRRQHVSRFSASLQQCYGTVCLLLLDKAIVIPHSCSWNRLSS